MFSRICFPISQTRGCGEGNECRVPRFGLDPRSTHRCPTLLESFLKRFETFSFPPHSFLPSSSPSSPFSLSLSPALAKLSPLSTPLSRHTTTMSASQPTYHSAEETQRTSNGHEAHHFQRSRLQEGQLELGESDARFSGGDEVTRFYSLRRSFEPFGRHLAKLLDLFISCLIQ